MLTNVQNCYENKINTTNDLIRDEKNALTIQTENLSPEKILELFNSQIRLQEENLTEPLNRNHNIMSLDQIIEFYDAQNNPSVRNLPKQVTPNHTIGQEKKTVNFLVHNRTNKLKFGKKIYEFYNAPITKFWQNTIMYLVFLISFAYIVLVKTPPKPSYPEIFVLVYIFSYGLDKMRECLQTDTSRFSGKIKIFFSKVLNSLDMFFIITIIVALGFRLSKINEHIKVARLLYCVNTIYWYVKFMEFFIINKYTGPLIIIASRMLIDLFNFVIILLILLISFGLSRQAIKFPNEDFQWNLVKKIFLEPYFMLYGEVYADTIDPACTADEPNAPQCQFGHWITPLTMTIFMIIACLLFLSILIASFNNTFIRISRQSAQFWKCQRYHFVTSYESKPMLAPPFVVISHIYMIIKYFIRLCLCKKIKYDRKLKSFLSEDMVQRLHDFEENCFYQYNYDLELSLNDKMEERIHQTSTKVENISARIDDIFFKENMTKLSLYKVELRLQKLEEFTFEAVTQLNHLYNLLRRNGQLGNKLNRVATLQQNDEAPVLEASISNSIRQRRITISGDGHQKSTANSNNIGALNKSNSRYQSQNRIPLSSDNQLLIKRKRLLSDSQKITVDEKLEEDQSTKYTQKISDKNSDTEEATYLPEDNFEIEYLNKYVRKASISSSNASLNSSLKFNNERDAATRRKINKIESDLSKKSKILNKRFQNDTDNSDSEQILNEIYESQKDQNQLLLASQYATGLDQCTLHPFVYLHSVIKPPLAEYTSITDCIDTTTVDRPPSPPLSASVSNTNPILHGKSLNTNGLVDNINDYRATESARSIVARQESEILRLAEESQHVIISQLLSKLVEDKNNEDKRNSEILSGSGNVLVSSSNNKRSSNSVNYQNLARNESKTQKPEELVTKLITVCSETDEEDDFVGDHLGKTFVSEEDELRIKHGNKNLLQTKLAVKKPNLLTSGQETGGIPINMLNRNSSQLFYAQSQAKVLCLSNEEEIEKDTNSV